MVGKYSTGVISKIKNLFGRKLSQYIFKRYLDIFKKFLEQWDMKHAKTACFQNSLFDELSSALICPKNVNLAFDILFVFYQEYEFSTLD